MNLSSTFAKKISLYVSITLGLIPLSLAAPFGGNPLGTALEAVGELLNFTSLGRNRFAVEGITRLALFMVVYAISYHGFLKVFQADTNAQGKKTAGIVSFAVAMIGTIAVNPIIGDANAGLFQGVVASLLVLGVFVGGGCYAIFGLKPKEENDTLGWVYHMLGALLILLLFAILQIWTTYSGLAVTGAASSPVALAIYETTVYWTRSILALLFIVKIFQWLKAGGVGAGLSNMFSRRGSSDSDPARREGVRGANGGAPGQVEEFEGRMIA